MAEHLGSLIIEKDLTVREVLKLASLTTPGQVLTISDVEGTVSAVDIPSLNRIVLALPDLGTGTLAGDFNAQDPFTTITANDLFVVDWALTSESYLYMGANGTFGVGGADTAIVSDFYLLGAGATIGNEFVDSLFRILNDADQTKKIAFSAASIAPNTTRTILMPNYDVDLGALLQPPQTGIIDPVGAVNPRYEGDLYVNQTEATSWIATATTNLSWKRADNVKSNEDTVDPTATDDSTKGYEPLSLWLNTSSDVVWICKVATAGAAVWIDISGSGGGGGASIIYDVNQVGHGLAVDLSIALPTGSINYVPASSVDNTLISVGIVVEVVDVDNFKFQDSGMAIYQAGGLVPGQAYYQGQAPGSIINLELPNFVQPLFVAQTANTILINISDMYVFEDIGDEYMAKAVYDPNNNGIVENSEALNGRPDTDFEDALGNPTVDGDVLSSTILGVRTWITVGGGGTAPTGLEQLTEGGQTGWRLIGMDPAQFGDIGDNAVDLSISDSPSVLYGATGFGSFAVGGETTASGALSSASGFKSVASGDLSLAHGQTALAAGNSSIAMGVNSSAALDESTAIGRGASTAIVNQTALGSYTIPNIADAAVVVGIGPAPGSLGNGLELYWDGTLSAPLSTNALITARGAKTLITKEYADANYSGGGGAGTGLELITEGGNTGWRLVGRNPTLYGDTGVGAVDFSLADEPNDGATGDGAFAEGFSTKATGAYAHAEGTGTTAEGDYSHSEGEYSGSTGTAAHSEGSGGSEGAYSHSEGYGYVGIDTDEFDAEAAHAEGDGYVYASYGAHAEGGGAIDIGSDYAHAEGEGYVNGAYAGHAEGDGTVDTGGDYGHAEGSGTTVSASAAHAEGQDTVASGITAHAEGAGTTASGNASHAEGQNTVASGSLSHAGGLGSIAAGANSFAHGEDAIATADNSIALGKEAEVATGTNNIAIGEGTRATEAVSMTALGKWNLVGDQNNILEVGIGTSAVARQNGLGVRSDGIVVAQSSTIAGLTATGQTRALITKEYADATYTGGGGVPEAPNDGQQYGRQSLAWTVITGGGGSAALTQDVLATVTVGGITQGDIVPLGTSFTDFAILLISPTQQPMITTPNSLTLTGVTPASVEVGTLYINTLVGVYNPGVITNGDGVTTVALTGLEDPTGTAFSGVGINPATGAIAMNILAGSNTWSLYQDYFGNTAPYYDSTGTQSHIFDPLRVSGFKTDLSDGITGKYKTWWYAGTIPAPTTSGAVRALPNNNFYAVPFSISIPANNKYVSFYTLDTITSVQVLYVESSYADVSGTFTPVPISVDDAGGTAVNYIEWRSDIGGIGYPVTATYNVTLFT